MRTTLNLADDVVAAVKRLRRERGLGLSEAVNELARRGLREREDTAPFEQDSSPMGALIDVANVAEALDLLEGPSAR
ncbi:MAG: CopG family transcriptional regulator [Actinomycetota bacterium]|nr:CopG family transcriptional regulator [Actinomycetota bacterium]